MISAIVYSIMQILDVYITYRITPNLHREANILVTSFDLGWQTIILSAIIACVIMFAAQIWVWKKLLSRFPAENKGYASFYRHILFERSSSGKRKNHDFKGIVASILMVVLYGLIAAKLLVVIWNVSIYYYAIRIDNFTQLLLAKNLLSGLFGAFMFFAYLYWIYKKQ